MFVLVRPGRMQQNRGGRWMVAKRSAIGINQGDASTMPELCPESVRKSRRFCILCIWLRVLAHLGRNSRRLAWIGLLLAPAFLVIDSITDFLFFNEGRSAFYDVLFHPEPMELYMRLLFSLLFIAFSIYAALLLDRAERVERELRVLRARRQRLLADIAALDRPRSR